VSTKNAEDAPSMETKLNGTGHAHSNPMSADRSSKDNRLARARMIDQSMEQL